MVARKTKNGKNWLAYFRYVDWQGIKRAKKRETFKTKREALEWERNFLETKTLDVNMRFDLFVERYLQDKKPRIKYNTYLIKKSIIENKILPYFKRKILSEIVPADVIQWQNTLLSFRDKEDKPYSQTYLRTVQNQLSAIFNHACNYYNLKDNPSRKAGKMGKSKSKEMKFWIKEEFLKFIETMKDDPIAYYAFETLFWSGMRVGELLALTPDDIDLDKKTITISKSYQRLQSKDYITSPKTEKSNRIISIPTFIVELLSDYITSLYGVKKTDRIFTMTKSYLHKKMDYGANKAGVKRIRIHDLRHSHVALLIEMGFSPVAIADRLGHESIEVTYNYAHLYPSKQIEIANKLDAEMKGASDE